MARTPPSWPTVRDRALFFTGLAGIVYEVLIIPHPDATVLLLLGTMCGLPTFLQRDDAARKDDKAKDGDAGG